MPQNLLTASYLVRASVPKVAQRVYGRMMGFSEAQFAGFGLSFGLGAFMLYMLFIIGQLAWESKAGRFGTFVIFLGLAFGMLGFVTKLVIQYAIGI